MRTMTEESVGLSAHQEGERLMDNPVDGVISLAGEIHGSFGLELGSDRGNQVDNLIVNVERENVNAGSGGNWNEIMNQINNQTEEERVDVEISRIVREVIIRFGDLSVKEKEKQRKRSRLITGGHEGVALVDEYTDMEWEQLMLSTLSRLEFVDKISKQIPAFVKKLRRKCRYSVEDFNEQYQELGERQRTEMVEEEWYMMIQGKYKKEVKEEKFDLLMQKTKVCLVCKQLESIGKMKPIPRHLKNNQSLAGVDLSRGLVNIINSQKLCYRCSLKWRKLESNCFLPHELFHIYEGYKSEINCQLKGIIKCFLSTLNENYKEKFVSMDWRVETFHGVLRQRLDGFGAEAGLLEIDVQMRGYLQSAYFDYLLKWNKDKEINFLLSSRELLLGDCLACGRMEFPSEMKRIPQKLLSSVHHKDLLEEICWEEKVEFYLFPKRYCKRCYLSLSNFKLPRISKANGFRSNTVEAQIRGLNTVEAASVSCILPCFTLTKKAGVTQPKTIGPAIYIPIDPTITFQNLLPRAEVDLNWLEMQFCEIGRGARKDPSIRGIVDKKKVIAALRILLEKPVYRELNCTVDTYWMERELEEDANYELIDTSERVVEEKQMHSSLLLAKTEYSDFYEKKDGEEGDVGSNEDSDVEEIIRLEGPNNDQMFGQLRPFTRTLNTRIDAVVTDTASRMNIWPILNNSSPQRIPEEAMFPISFGGRRRIPIRLERYSVLDMCQSEVERADFQHQSIQKIFHDYFRVIQDYVNRRRAFVYTLLKENPGNREDQKVECLQDETLAEIRSGPVYWQKRLGDLFAMLQQESQPTFFLTYSPNEIEWGEMLCMLQYSEEKRTGQIPKTWSVDEMRVMAKKDKQYLLASNPMVALRMIMRRHLLLKRLVWDGKNSIFGKVNDFYIRVEFQMRGSPHYHILIWIDGAPIWRPNSEESDKEVVEFVDKYITCKYVGCDEKTKKQLQTQRHIHTFTCSGMYGCRFRFPIPPMIRTKILTELKRKDYPVEDIKQKRSIYDQMMIDLETVKDGDAITTEEWLKKWGVSEDQYIELLRLFYVHQAQVMLRRSPGEKSINKYNPILQALWGGNMDISYVMNGFACARYILSYVCKSYREISSTLQIYRNNHKGQSETLDQKLKGFAAKFMTSSQIGAQEALCHVTGAKLSICSRSIESVNTNLPEKRMRKFKKETKENVRFLMEESPEAWQDLKEEFDEAYQDGLREHYIKRSTKLRVTCYGEWIRYFDFKLKVKKYTEEEETRGELQSVFKQDRGEGYTVKRKNQDKPKILKLRPLDPENYRKEWLYQQILLWTAYTELIKANTLEELEDLYKEKMEEIQRNRERCNAKSESFFEEFNEEMKQIRRENGMEEGYERNNNMSSTENEWDNQINKVVKFSDAQIMNMAQTFRQNMDTLNIGQQILMNDLIYKIKSGDVPQYLFLEGSGGNGKSYLIQLLVEYATITFQRLQKDDEEYLPILKVAPTGVAAVNINGMTIHKAFNIKTYTTNNQQGTQDMSKGRNQLRNAKFRYLYFVQLIIVDEISAVSIKMLKEIDARMRYVKGCNKPFGGVSVICAGDFYQLAPVFGKSILEPKSETHFLWELFQKYTLDVNVRHQNDPEYKIALEELRKGKCSEKTIQMLEERVISEEKYKELEAEDALHHKSLFLHYENEAVEWCNERRMQHSGYDIETVVAVDKFPQTAKEQEPDIKARIATMSKKETGGLYTQLRLKKQYPYVVTDNIDVEDEIVNGTPIEIIEIISHDDSRGKDNTTLWIKGTEKSVGKRRREETMESKWNTDEDAFPIKRVKRNFLAGPYPVNRTQYPIAAFGASTFHKAQGRTLPKVIVATQKILENGEVDQRGRMITSDDLYVGTSRVPYRDGMFIYPKLPKLTEPTSKQRFTHQCMEKIPSWKITLPFPSPDKINIAFHNGQGAGGKKAHYEKTEICNYFDILGLAECYNKDMFVEINNLEKIVEIKGRNRMGTGLTIFVNKTRVKIQVLWISTPNHLNNQLEGIILKLIPKKPQLHKELIVGFFYVHPKTKLISVIEEIIKYKENGSKIIIIGDFNHRIKKKHHILLEQHQIHQFLPNLSKHTLKGPTDFILSNEDLKCEFAPCHYSDHEFIWTSI